MQRVVHPIEGEISVPPGLASVTYPGPAGGVVETTIDDDQVVLFGVSGECKIRFGHAPTRDPEVPGIAGRLLTIGARLIVECAETPGYRVLELLVPGEPTRLVPLGEAHSPRARTFAVLVAGSGARCWRMDIAVRRRTVPRGTSSDPTCLPPVRLNEREQQLLAAYARPLGRGSSEPATHAQVAADLNVNYNTARSQLYKIGQRFFAAELPMPDIGEKRTAVVECARIHGLLPCTSPET